MDTGFITLHRKIKEHPIWNNPGLAHLFIHLLLCANYEFKQVLWNRKLVEIGRGQLITGRYALAEATGLNPNTVKDYLKLLSELNIITIKSTNKFSLITIVKYSDYQDKKERDTNKTPTKHQPDTTNNKDNNYNKDNKQLSGDKPRKGKKFDIGTYPRADYIKISDAYQKIKGVKLSGPEYLPIAREIKLMFKSGRTPEQVIEAMETCNANYEDWAMSTVRMKIADVVAGKLLPKIKPGQKVPLIIKESRDI